MEFSPKGMVKKKADGRGERGGREEKQRRHTAKNEGTSPAKAPNVPETLSWRECAGKGGSPWEDHHMDSGVKKNQTL